MLEPRGGAGGGGRDFSLPRLDDETQRLELGPFRGRPVVVNFWASWCVPRRQEMPELQAMADRFRDRRR